MVIAYDDSDGWYDHQMPPIVNQSASAPTLSREPAPAAPALDALPGVAPAAHAAQGRCGYGPRLPLLVISPWPKELVDHTVTDQTSIIRFIEDNWLNGQRIGRVRSTPSRTRSSICSISTTPQHHERSCFRIERPTGESGAGRYGQDRAASPHSRGRRRDSTRVP